MKWGYVSKPNERDTIHTKKSENGQPFIAVEQASL